MADMTGPDPLSASERVAVLREHLEREKSRRRDAEAAAARAEAAAASLAAEAVAAERSRLFVAIRHAISLDKPWRGEALDVIDSVWREQP